MSFINYLKEQLNIKEDVEDVYYDEDELPNDKATPEEDDCYITPSGRLGSMYSVSCGGKFIDEVPEMDEALQIIKDWQAKNKFWPNIWFVSDHGNMSLIDINGNEIQEAIQPNKTKLQEGVPEKHQLKIALDTLKLHKIGANIMGGMNHKQAVKVLKQNGYSEDKIKGLLKAAGHDDTDIAEFMTEEENITEPRTLSKIASEIRKDWTNVNFAAKPYLSAMSSMDSINDKFGADDGRSIVAYFLSNAGSWKGEVAKRIKEELKKMLKR